MPYSVRVSRDLIKAYVLKRFPDRSARILDVGAGAGTYADLLGSYYVNLDACEVWQPYIKYFNLKSKYRRVYHRDIVSYKPAYYDLVILGDVLEHMSVENAKRVLARFSTRCKELLVVVPFKCIQGEVYGNPYEVHRQNDLTLQTMQQRYGNYLQLMNLFEQSRYKGYQTAVYHKRLSWWRTLLCNMRRVIRHKAP